MTWRNQYAAQPEGDEPYVIVNTETCEIVEEYYDLAKCHHRCNTLNNIEECEGRPRVFHAEYRVQE